MLTESQKRAMKRYSRKTTQFVFRFRNERDADIIEKLKGSANKVGYIRDLIKRDIGDAE